MGTLVRLRISLSDRPGALAGVAAIIAEHGGNITAIDVQQSGAADVVDDMVVDLPDGADLGQLRLALRASGAGTLLSHQNAHAVDAVVGGLEDPVEEVRRVALASLGTTSSGGVVAPSTARAVRALGGILERDENWAMRVLAAQALGRLGQTDRAGAVAELTGAITRDPYALVREASLEALASFDPDGARPMARTVAATDPEPRVREAAANMAR